MTVLEQVFGTDDPSVALLAILDATDKTGQPFEDYVTEQVAKTYDPSSRWLAVRSLSKTLGFVV